MFDIETFLRKYSEIQSITKKEIFLDWCPYCGAPGKHASTISVARQKEVFYCFRCGQKGNWAKIVAKLANISYPEARELVDDGLGFTPIKEKEEPKEEFKLYMPPKSGWTVRSENYLLERGLSRKTIKEFGLYYCRVGFYKERIIIPVVANGKAVTFQARAVKEGMEPRYRMPKDSPKSWFNMDRHKKGQKVCIVEGPFDVMKLHEFGIFAICPLGKTVTDDQKKDLTRLRGCSILLLQDRDAAQHIKKIHRTLSDAVDVRIAPQLRVNDPSELSSRDEGIEALEDVHDTAASFDLERVYRFRDKRVC